MIFEDADFTRVDIHGHGTSPCSTGVRPFASPVAVISLATAHAAVIGITICLILGAWLGSFGRGVNLGRSMGGAIANCEGPELELAGRDFFQSANRCLIFETEFIPGKMNERFVPQGGRLPRHATPLPCGCAGDAVVGPRVGTVFRRHRS